MCSWVGYKRKLHDQGTKWLYGSKGVIINETTEDADRRHCRDIYIFTYYYTFTCPPKHPLNATRHTDTDKDNPSLPSLASLPPASFNPAPPPRREWTSWLVERRLTNARFATGNQIRQKHGNGVRELMSGLVQWGDAGGAAPELHCVGCMSDLMLDNIYLPRHVVALNHNNSPFTL